MKIAVVIPLTCYEDLVNACTNKPGQTGRPLRQGVIIDDPQHGKAVEIICEEDLAQRVLTLARMICPDAAPYIDHSIQIARNQQ
jgi:hypothetical protein